MAAKASVPQTTRVSGEVRMKAGLYQFVPHFKIDEFKADGWTVEDFLSDTNHGVFSVLMRKPDDPLDDEPDPKAD